MHYKIHTRTILFQFYWSILLLLPASFVLSQSIAPETESYSINEGLADRVVKDIIQSREGFLWIATPNGLNKFDGYDFNHYANHPSHKFPISANNIEALEESADGNLVITYGNNFEFFDIFNPGNLENQKISLSQEDGIRGIVRHIYTSEDGMIYALTISKDGTNLFELQSDTTFQLVFQIKERHRKMTTTAEVLKLRSGNFMINDAEKGLRTVNEEGKVLRKFKRSDFHYLDNPRGYPGQTYFMHEDNKGQVWIAFRQMRGVYYYESGTQLFESYQQLPVEGGYYSNLWEDQQGNLLLAQTNGSNQNPEVQKLFCLQPDGITADFSYVLRSGHYINCVYSQDFSKSIILGLASGLKFVQNTNSRIKTIMAQENTHEIHGLGMGGIVGDQKGYVYITGVEDFWYKLDLENDVLDTIILRNPVTSTPDYFKEGKHLFLDEEGYIWGINQNQKGFAQIIKYDTSTCNNVVAYYPEPLVAFTQSTTGLYWVLSHPRQNNPKGKLLSFDKNTLKFNPPFKNDKGINPLEQAEPYVVIEAKDGNLWVGTDNGLIRIDVITEKTKTYSIRRKPKDNGLSSNVIYAIHEDEEGRLWLGTDGGINVLNPKTGEVQVYDKSKGLADNKVFGILPDEKGNYWLSTYNGLSYFDTYRGQFRNFYEFDGLSNDQFNRFSHFKDEHGRYYFGGVNGINAFFPEDLLIAEPIPSVVLTRFVRFNTRKDSLIVQTQDLDQLKQVVVSPYDSYIQLNFTLPVYSRPSKNQFSVWLKGLDKDWIYIGNQPYIRYNSLPPGNYQLHIKGADPSGNWSNEPRIIAISVQQIFYKTSWFILTLAVSVAALIYFLVNYRLNQKLKVERLRTKLSSDLHDELSGLLSGIAMQTDVLQMTAKDQHSMDRLKNIGEVSRMAMSKMSDVIWSIDSRKDKVDDLIQRMQEHANEILSPLNISYEFKIGKIERQHKMPVNIRQDLYFIYKEAVNNIAKHSNASKAEIHFGNVESHFEMLVKDNGPLENGVPKAKITSKTGQGLTNLKMRAQRLKADLQIKRDKGYTIQLSMKKFA